MPELPKKKVGIIACSGEEIAEGTVTRLAALQVLERLRPHKTVTICLPLFLAGGEGDRAFAKFHHTIAIDGCDKRCAAQATEMYSGKPAAGIVVTDIVREGGLGPVEGRRRLNEAGRTAVAATAERVADLVDDLLGSEWDRTREGHGTDDPLVGAGQGTEVQAAPENAAPQEAAVQATCSCGSGIPIQKVEIEGKSVSLVGLSLIFERFEQAGKNMGSETAGDLLDVARIYNPIPKDAEGAYTSALIREYAAFLHRRRKTP
jgi:uncharacterized metal-binding protein